MKKLLILVMGLVILLSGCGPKVDERIKTINRVIDRFIEVYAEDYIKIGEETVLNENVIVAIKALSDNGYDVSLDDFIDSDSVKAYFDGLEYTNVKTAYKAVLVSQAFEFTHEKATTYLEGLTEDDVDVWSYTYGLIALRKANVNQELQDKLLEKLNIIREEDYRDADYAGYALIAASDETIDKAPLYKLINDNLTETGIEFYGNPNASVTASVILGLIADGQDPTSEAYITNEVDLIDALLGYEIDGGFSNERNEAVDLLFATPQSFSALVSYKLYQDKKPANIILQ